MPIYFITSNKKKFKEAQAIIPSLEHLDLHLTEIQEDDPKVIIRRKLQEASQEHDGEFIVEDTGLYMRCLGGLPGPFIKWFIKKLGNEGLFKTAQALEDYYAEAKSIIGYRNENGEDFYFEGSVDGLVVEPRGEQGFGWDPIFLPDGHQKTFAEMSFDEKNTISMRQKVFNELKDFLLKKASK